MQSDVDVWRVLTKAAMASIGRGGRGTEETSAEEIAARALAQCAHCGNVESYRSRLEAYIRDLLLAPGRRTP
jgi:hypothetical protein